MSVFVFPVLYFGWKIVHKTRIVKPTELNLHHQDFDDLAEYEQNFVPQKSK